MIPSLARDHVRRIGALAGLAPALAALVVLIMLGASPTGDAVLWFAGITAVAIGAGWLIGPRATGSFPSDLWTAAAFAATPTRPAHGSMFGLCRWRRIRMA